MSKIFIKSTNSWWWSFFPLNFPVELTGRLSDDDWTAFITELNDAAKTAQTDYYERHSCWLDQFCLGCLCAACLVSVIFTPIAIVFLSVMIVCTVRDNKQKHKAEKNYYATRNTILSSWNSSVKFKRAVISADIDVETQKHTTVSGSGGYVSSQVHTEETYFLVISIGPREVEAASHIVTVLVGDKGVPVQVDATTTGKDILEALPDLLPGYAPPSQPRLTMINDVVLLPSCKVMNALAGEKNKVLKIV